MTTETKFVHHESCWKAADLRGRYPEQVSPALFERIGGAVGTLLEPGARVLVAGDFRLSTPTLKAALIEGLKSAGVEVLDAGQIPTPIAYFAASTHQPNAVLIVTASHNPAEDNGLKLLLEGRPPVPAQFQELRRLAEEGELRQGSGSVTQIDPVPDYERFIAARWKQLDPAALPMPVLDAGNGAWSEIAPRIFAALGFAVQCLSCVIDGRFPDRPSDCSRPANLRRLREMVASHGRAIGIAWDGDGDRVAVVDETGYAVSADELSMLMTRELFTPGAYAETLKDEVVIDIKIASAAQREVEQLGGVALLERTGHAFMRTRMIASGARLGLDACGHFFFGELQGADDGLFSAFMLLSLMQRTKMSLRELVQSLPVSYSSPELRIPLALLSFDQARETLLQAFSQARVDTLDGVRLSVTEGVVLLRRSGTEPVLSLRLEGMTDEGYRELLKQVMELLPSARASMQSQLQEHA